MNEDTLIINGQEIMPFDESAIEVTYFNHSNYTVATLTLNKENFNIMVLKSDIERLKRCFKND